MFLKEIDILSPEITLFYNHSLSHSSIISGILTIITLILIALCSICYAVCILDRKDEVPKVSSYNIFTEDAGEFPINSSSFFHFLSIAKDAHHPEEEEFDFTSFNLIGIDTYIQDYEKNDDLNKYDHWLYGFCNNETDTKGINHLITQKHFIKSACIRKYFNSSEQKYYDTNDINFKWPIMAHGNFNPNRKFYTVILTKCCSNILNIVFNGSYNCKNDTEREEEFKYGGAIHFNFIDQYIDILNYKDSYKKYFYIIENILDKDNYSINHLNFNPSIIKTHNGFFLDKYEKELTYTYDRSDVLTYSNKGNIHMVYSLWLKNRLNYYERTYKRIQDVLSDIGGVAQAIMTIAIFINNFINKYIILTDTEKLLTKEKITINEVCSHKRIIKINNSFIKRETPFEEIKEKDKKIVSIGSKEDMMKKNDDNTSYPYQKETINSPIYNDEKNYKFEETEIVDKVGNNNKENVDTNCANSKNAKNENLTFWNFFIYKFTFGKKYKNIKLYELFREKMISVENLIKNHLNIINLLKYNEIEKVD